MVADVMHWGHKFNGPQGSNADSKEMSKTQQQSTALEITYCTGTSVVRNIDFLIHRL